MATGQGSPEHWGRAKSAASACPHDHVSIAPCMQPHPCDLVTALPFTPRMAIRDPSKG